QEEKTKETLKIMGCSSEVYALHWWIVSILQLVLTDFLILLSVKESTFKYSDNLLVFFWLVSVSFAIVMYCFLLSTFFSRARTAATVGAMIFEMSFFPYYHVSLGETTLTKKLFSCILAPTCIALGGDALASLEGGLVGVRWDNVHESYGGSLSYTMSIGMLWLDALLYGVLAWYFDKVLPTEYGTQLSWNFPLVWLFCGAPKETDDPEVRIRTYMTSTTGSNGLAKVPLLEGGEEGQSTSNRLLEAVPQSLRTQISQGRAVSLRKLRKVYANAKVAVKGLDLDLFEGQISVLLGANGAGKTSLISMVTGLIPISSGKAILRGHSGARAKHDLGVCPQQDTLFGSLTVEQHLQLYAAVKGVPRSEIENEVKQLTREVGLVEKKHQRASSLSGGQKRKLSIAMALIGGSKIVVLDEPTSGLDPYSRRSIWSIL
ncbi:unnamed protein product, partial [Chrysoparadoxa australica]